MLNTWRKLFFALFFFSLLSSCKKMVEDKKKELLMEIITNGTWYVHLYNDGATDITQEFTDYQFRFFADGVVTGKKGEVMENGAWSGDIQNISIIADFPSAPPPLSKLTGVWKITDSGLDFVKAEMNKPSGKNLLHLLKNK